MGCPDSSLGVMAILWHFFKCSFLGNHGKFPINAGRRMPGVKFSRFLSHFGPEILDCRHHLAPPKSSFFQGVTRTLGRIITVGGCQTLELSDWITYEITQSTRLLGMQPLTSQPLQLIAVPKARMKIFLFGMFFKEFPRSRSVLHGFGWNYAR
jgi:hypothetical protein